MLRSCIKKKREAGGIIIHLQSKHSFVFFLFFFNFFFLKIFFGCLSSNATNRSLSGPIRTPSWRHQRTSARNGGSGVCEDPGEPGFDVLFDERLFAPTGSGVPRPLSVTSIDTADTAPTDFPSDTPPVALSIVVLSVLPSVNSPALGVASSVVPGLACAAGATPRLPLLWNSVPLLLLLPPAAPRPTPAPTLPRGDRGDSSDELGTTPTLPAQPAPAPAPPTLGRGLPVPDTDSRLSFDIPSSGMFGRPPAGDPDAAAAAAVTRSDDGDDGDDEVGDACDDVVSPVSSDPVSCDDSARSRAAYSARTSALAAAAEAAPAPDVGDASPGVGTGDTRREVTTVMPAVSKLPASAPDNSGCGCAGPGDSLRGATAAAAASSNERPSPPAGRAAGDGDGTSRSRCSARRGVALPPPPPPPPPGASTEARSPLPMSPTGVPAP
eukprot:Rhum_TRINITY_DN15189_c7_g3::Rhum_TRINITY_DN15189_c7_g3_i7::g.142080::m.142080